MSNITITPEMIKDYNTRVTETTEDYSKNILLSFRQSLLDTNSEEQDINKKMMNFGFLFITNLITTASCEEKAIINFYHSGNHKNENEKYCTICNEEFKRYDICRKRDEWDCPHLFHGKCISNITECPICHTKIENKLMSFKELKETNIIISDNNDKK